MSATRNNTADAHAASPDLSVERARSTILLFMPGVTPGILLFVVFGTTKPFRDHMYATFVPKRWQKDGSGAAASAAAASQRKGRSHSTAAASHQSYVFPSEESGDEQPTNPYDDRSMVRMRDLEANNYDDLGKSSEEGPILPIMKPPRTRTVPKAFV